jgi:hypothetical protein
MSKYSDVEGEVDIFRGVATFPSMLSPPFLFVAFFNAYLLPRAQWSVTAQFVTLSNWPKMK